MRCGDLWIGEIIVPWRLRRRQRLITIATKEGTSELSVARRKEGMGGRTSDELMAPRALVLVVLELSRVITRRIIDRSGRDAGNATNGESTTRSATAPAPDVSETFMISPTDLVVGISLLRIITEPRHIDLEDLKVVVC